MKNKLSQRINDNVVHAAILSFFVFLLVLSQIGYGQEKDTLAVKKRVPLRHWVDLGFGIGVDYGGLIGVKAGVLVIPNLSVFGTVGYYYVGVGWNAGVTYHILRAAPKRWIRPTVKMMYGTNGSIKVSGSKYSSLNKTYLGFTPGVGVELRFGRAKRNGFDLDVNYLIHGKDFTDGINTLKNDPSYTVKEPWPVGISIGYHHEF